jgi:hypothetical protein
MGATLASAGAPRWKAANEVIEGNDHTTTMLGVVLAATARTCPALRSPASERVRRLLALTVPFLIWMAATAWCDWSRPG